MKKFGTPSGAGPGVAEEKVGFCGVGLPSGLVNWSGEGVFRSRGVVRRSVPVAPEVVCSVPLTGALVEPGRRVGCPGWAVDPGEDEPDGDWEGEPPDGGEEGDGDGVTGVLGTETGGGGSGRLGVGGSVGVVTGPTVRAGAGRVPGVNAAASAAAPISAAVSLRLMIRRRQTALRAIPCAFDPSPDSSREESS
jgi:hypothetical protein